MNSLQVTTASCQRLAFSGVLKLSLMTHRMTQLGNSASGRSRANQEGLDGHQAAVDELEKKLIGTSLSPGEH